MIVLFIAAFVLGFMVLDAFLANDLQNETRNRKDFCECPQCTTPTSKK